MTCVHPAACLQPAASTKSAAAAQPAAAARPPSRGVTCSEETRNGRRSGCRKEKQRAVRQQVGAKARGQWGGQAGQAAGGEAKGRSGRCTWVICVWHCIPVAFPLRAAAPCGGTALFKRVRCPSADRGVRGWTRPAAGHVPHTTSPPAGGKVTQQPLKPLNSQSSHSTATQQPLNTHPTLTQHSLSSHSTLTLQNGTLP